MLLVQRMGGNITSPSPPPPLPPPAAADQLRPSSSSSPHMETQLSPSTLSSMNSGVSHGLSSQFSERSMGNLAVKVETQAPFVLRSQSPPLPQAQPLFPPHGKSKLQSHPPLPPQDLSPSPLPTTPPPPTQTQPSNPPFTLRPARPQDASQIATLGATTFAETFGFSMPRVDLDAYLAEAYDLDTVKGEIEDKGGRRIVVAVLGGSQCKGKWGDVGAQHSENHCSESTDADESQPQPRSKPDRQTTAGNGESTDDRANTDETAEKVIGFAQLNLSPTSEPCLADFPQRDLIELQRLYVHLDFQGFGIGKELMNAVEDIAGDIFLERMGRERWESEMSAWIEGRGKGEADTPTHISQYNTNSTTTRRRDKRTPERRGGSNERTLHKTTREPRDPKEPRHSRNPSRRRKNASGKVWLGVWEGNFTAQRVYEKQGYKRVGEHEFKMGRCIQTDWIMMKELEVEG